MTVHLVGAGPGDPGLITARGLELVRSCDALVYDRLVSSELVDEAPAGAIRIARDHLDQAEIDRLLVRLGRRGLNVVRLKGGDPFVFGRGGEEALEAVGHGLGDVRPLEGESVLTTAAGYADGQWRLLIRRPLAAPEAEDRLQLGPGRAIPMAVFAWDGSNGEAGKQGSISTWYFLYLDRPSGKGVYVWPALATLLTAGLGLVLVARAQRRSRGGADTS